MKVLLTLILFIFVGFWLMGVIGRLFLGRWVSNRQREFQQQFNTSGRKNSRREGEVTITGGETRTGHGVNKQVGEYVDFEEVD